MLAICKRYEIVWIYTIRLTGKFLHKTSAYTYNGTYACNIRVHHVSNGAKLG